MTDEEKRLARQFAVTNKKGLQELIDKYEGLVKFLRDMLGAGAGDEEDDEIQVNPADVGAMDSRGRRVVKPPSAADLAMFQASHGLTPRRIRNLGDN
jgi:hypothetical protein